MKTRPWCRTLVLAAGVMMGAGAQAQSYPVKPIRFIVGPGPDSLAREIVETIKGELFLDEDERKN